MKTISISDLATVSGGETFAQGHVYIGHRDGSVDTFPFNLSRRPNTDDNGAITGGNRFGRITNYSCRNGGICGGTATDR